MKPSWQILVGDVREKLRECADEHFQCVATSPPYWGLRDYGVDGQIGLEETPEAFIEVLVGVFREVKRVMRPDATLWINMGDCYAGASAGNAPRDLSSGVPTGTRGQQPGKAARRGKIGKSTLQGSQSSQEASRAEGAVARKSFGAAKPKDLVGQPWMLAFALRDELGFYLRAENIWHKRSVMPESCTDRTTRAHEQVFLFSKEPNYFYDADAVREPDCGHASGNGFDGRQGGSERVGPQSGGVGSGPWFPGGGRNKRSVWTLGPEPSNEEHFAAFPTKLVEPCILAGTSERGCCPGCGSPWKRVKEAARGGSIGKSWHDHAADDETGNFKTESSEGYQPAKTIGWEPSCDCEAADPIPCSVLDPFSGTATTGVVALKFGRNFCGIELNPKYAEIGSRRLKGAEEEWGTPLFESRKAQAAS